MGLINGVCVCRLIIIAVLVFILLMTLHWLRKSMDREMMAIKLLTEFMRDAVAVAEQQNAQSREEY